MIDLMDYSDDLEILSSKLTQLSNLSEIMFINYFGTNFENMDSYSKHEFHVYLSLFESIRDIIEEESQQLVKILSKLYEQNIAKKDIRSA